MVPDDDVIDGNKAYVSSIIIICVISKQFNILKSNNFLFKLLLATILILVPSTFHHIFHLS